MVEPVYSDTTEEIYGRLPNHYRVADSQREWQFKRWWAGLLEQVSTLKTLYDRIEFIPPDDGESNSTSDLVDPATADPAWLDWRAQFTGIRFLSSTSVAEKRALLLEELAGLTVGTKKAILAAARSTLIGDQYVNLYPRTVTQGSVGQGSMWDMLLITKASETLNQTLPDHYTTAAYPSFWSVTGATTTRPEMVTNTEMYDSRALRITAASTNISVGMRNNSAADRFAVTPTETVTAFMHMKVAVAGTYTGFLRLRWYDAGGSELFPRAEQEINVTWAMSQKYITAVVPANAVTASIDLVLTVVEGMTFEWAQIGARVGTETTWIVRTSDPVGTVTALNAKPAGIVLHHETFSATWDTIETNLPTWDMWDARSWDEIMEGGV